MTDTKSKVNKLVRWHTYSAFRYDFKRTNETPVFSILTAVWYASTFKFQFLSHPPIKPIYIKDNRGYYKKAKMQRTNVPAYSIKGFQRFC